MSHFECVSLRGLFERVSQRSFWREWPKGASNESVSKELLAKLSQNGFLSNIHPPPSPCYADNVRSTCGQLCRCPNRSNQNLSFFLVRDFTLWLPRYVKSSDPSAQLHCFGRLRCLTCFSGDLTYRGSHNTTGQKLNQTLVRAFSWHFFFHFSYFFCPSIYSSLRIVFCECLIFVVVVCIKFVIVSHKTK